MQRIKEWEAQSVPRGVRLSSTFLKYSFLGALIACIGVTLWYFFPATSNLTDAVKYYFYAEAQTMGIIISIELFGLYFILADLRRSNSMVFEPIKRMLFSDEIVTLSIYPGISAIILSFLFLNISPVLEGNRSAVFSWVFFTLSLGVISIFFLLDFTKNRCSHYLNPISFRKTLSKNNRSVEAALVCTEIDILLTAQKLLKHKVENPYYSVFDILDQATELRNDNELRRFAYRKLADRLKTDLDKDHLFDFEKREVFKIVLELCYRSTEWELPSGDFCTGYEPRESQVDFIVYLYNSWSEHAGAIREIIEERLQYNAMRLEAAISSYLLSSFNDQIDYFSMEHWLDFILTLAIKADDHKPVLQFFSHELFDKLFNFLIVFPKKPDETHKRLADLLFRMNYFLAIIICLDRSYAHHINDCDFDQLVGQKRRPFEALRELTDPGLKSSVLVQFPTAQADILLSKMGTPKSSLLEVLKCNMVIRYLIGLRPLEINVLLPQFFKQTKEEVLGEFLEGINVSPKLINKNDFASLLAMPEALYGFFFPLEEAYNLSFLIRFARHPQKGRDPLRAYFESYDWNFDQVQWGISLRQQIMERARFWEDMFVKNQEAPKPRPPKRITSHG